MSRHSSFILAVVVALTLVPVAGAGEPRLHLNARDNRRAKAVVVRLGDVADVFSPDRSWFAAPWIPHCSGYPGDRSSVTITGTAKSAFSHDGIAATIGSTAMFFASTRDAQRYWQLTVRRSFATCSAQSFARSWRYGARTLVARELRMAPTGADEARAFRTVTRLAPPGKPAVDYYQTTAFLRQDRAVAMVSVRTEVRCSCHVDFARVVARRLIRATQG
jgi:hypothetical protein